MHSTHFKAIDWVDQTIHLLENMDFNLIIVIILCYIGRRGLGCVRHGKAYHMHYNMDYIFH